MDPSIHTSNAESNSAALVVFGPNQIDTSRAETLVQCLGSVIDSLWKTNLLEDFVFR